MLCETYMPIPVRTEIKQQLIELLKERGQLKTNRVYELLSAKWGLTEAEKNIKRSGGSFFENEIRWARQELVIEGVIERPATSGRAVWRLAESTNLPPEQYEEEIELFEEGAVKNISVNAYERSKEARDACLKAFGYKCIVCEFDFELVYGEAGKGCIHVHHLKELGMIGKKYKINPLKDLVPICPNCHYMAHRRKPAYTVLEMKTMLKAKHSCKLGDMVTNSVK